MRMSTAKKVHYDAGPNMTPLVDIVMVILIFLMLTGTFATAEHFLQSNLPMTGAGGESIKPIAGVNLETQVNITVDPGAGGTGWIAQDGGNVKATNRKKLEEGLDALHNGMNSTGTKTEDIQVIIRPARSVKYEDLVDVYQAILEAKFKKVAFSTSH